jgi:hypothetical protein
MVPTDGGEQKEIVRANVANNSIDISPDGTRFTFIASNDKNGYFFVICDFHQRSGHCTGKRQGALHRQRSGLCTDKR